MRRQLIIAAFVVVVSLGTASAQMRGMGRGSGAIGSSGFGHGGIATRIGGVPAAGSGLPRSSFGFGPRFAPRFGGHFGFGPRIGFNGRVFFGDPFFRHRGFFRNRFGNQFFLGAGWPYYASWGYPFYASSYNDASAQNYDDYRAQQQINDDLQNLRDEVRRLREDNDEARYQARYEAQQPSAVPERPRETAADSPATVLVFRDGHKVETRNYAVVGQTLWLFNERRATKLPVSDLDLEATTKADEQRGIDFHLPRK